MRRLWQVLLRALEGSPLLGRPLGWVTWPLLWLSGVAVGCSIGGLLGAAAYAIFGTLGGHHLAVPELALNGLKDGAFYALIWLPGGSFVATVILAHRRAGLSALKDCTSR